MPVSRRLAGTPFPTQHEDRHDRDIGDNDQEAERQCQQCDHQAPPNRTPATQPAAGSGWEGFIEDISVQAQRA